jgi:hypothetical protein
MQSRSAVTVIIIIVVIIIAGALAVSSFRSQSETPSPTPTVTDTPGSSFELKLNQALTTAGITYTPLQVLEDSRCPQNVQCIQAGTLRLLTQIASAATTSTSMIFVLNQPATFGTTRVTMTDVIPYSIAGTTISPSDYRFKFEVR